MAPTVDRMIERPEIGSQLITALTGPIPIMVGLTASLNGAGGFGKTRLAAWATHHPDIVRRYPGGLLWLTLGQDPHGPELASRINDLSFVLSGKRPAVSEPEAAGAELGRLLDQRPPVLLVIDDVWDEIQIAPLRLGGSHCTRLFTTRIPDLLATSASRITVDTMSDGQAARLVSDGIAGLLPEHITSLAHLAGRWPVLLNIVNGVLRRRVEWGQEANEAAAEIARRLAEEGPAAFDPTRPADRQQAVVATIAASLSLLGVADQQRYLDLAVFPEDVEIPLTVLTLLWPRRDAAAFCAELIGLGLAAEYRLDPPGPRLALHDVIHAYLRWRRDPTQLREASRRLLDAAAHLLPVNDNREGGTSPWWLLPEQMEYLWRYVPYHLRQASLQEELAALLADLRWAEAKTHRFASVVPVTADLELCTDPALQALRWNLERSASLLGPMEPAEALGHTLASRLDGESELSTIVDRYRSTLSTPRLEPAWPLPDRPAVARAGPTGHTGGVTSCQFSPDGTLLATTSDDGTAIIWKYDNQLLTPKEVLSRHEGGVWGCAFSPDGLTLATSSTDRTLRIWDVASGRQSAALHGHSDWVRSCTFSPNGALLASVSSDCTVRLWQMRGGELRRVLVGHTKEVRTCVFSPDGDILATAGADKTVRLWRVADGSLLQVLENPVGGVWCCAFSPDGSVLAVASYGMVRLVNVTNGTERVISAGHADEIDSCCFSSDGQLLATTSYGRVQLWSTASGTKRADLDGHSGAVWKCSFSPGGEVLATVSNDQTVRLWNVGSGVPILVQAGVTSKVNSCSFSPGGDLIATTGYDSTVRLRRVDDGTEPATFRGHDYRVISCAFSPDGITLATTSFKSVKLWNIADGRELATFTGHTDWVRSCGFSPDSSLLATGSADRTVRLWQVSTGAEIGVLPSAAGVRSCSFSPDGTRLAAGAADGAILLWQVGDRTLQRVLRGHTSGVQSCVFSPDGALLATASADRSLRLWRVSDGHQEMLLSGHTSWADRCAFSPDGSLLASASNDQSIRVWDVSTGRCRCALRVAGPLAWVAWHPSGELIGTVGGAGVYLLRYIH